MVTNISNTCQVHDVDELKQCLTNVWDGGVTNGTIRKLGYGFLFAFQTTAMYCIISEIKRDIGQKSRFFHTPCIRRPR